MGFVAALWRTGLVTSRAHVLAFDFAFAFAFVLLLAIVDDFVVADGDGDGMCTRLRWHGPGLRKLWGSSSGP